MPVGNLAHSGFISSIHKDNLVEFYTTTANNQIITFTDTNGNLNHLNSLTIEADATDLFIQILPSDYCICITAGNSTTIDYCNIQQIKVLGNLGQNLKWYGLYF